MKLATAYEYIAGIKLGQRLALSRAITLCESARAEHQLLAAEILNGLQEHHTQVAAHTRRIGITGVPGVGKSTFIETLGLALVAEGHNIAVLPVDPSSPVSHGSLLGDKTRMEELSRHEQVYIRPSPSGNMLGGVAARTREAVFLCECAGFDTIIIETVGVGQSEVAVRSLADVFMLLLLPGAGDELQGMKRGIMEMADLLVINKVEDHNQTVGRLAQVAYQNALHLFPHPPSGLQVPVLTASALSAASVQQVWQAVQTMLTSMHTSGWFGQQRTHQRLQALKDLLHDRALKAFYAQHQEAISAAELAVQNGAEPRAAAVGV